MSLYYQDDQVTLFHGDCLEETDWTTADVLVADPPYGIGWQQSGYSNGRPHPGIQNDEDISTRDAALKLWGTKPGLVFGDIRKPFPNETRRVLVWKKPADSGLQGSTIWRKDWEPIFRIGNWPQRPAVNSSIIPTGAGSHRSYAQGVHPHAKPQDVLQRLITLCPPGIIADPFTGSGSTLIAAKALGRKAIGVELEEKYCEIAARRLSQGVLDFGESA
ncbi:DNA-methyltransferase [Psychromicrobium lacuslunae]|uniref:Methyltransferase n=1 Tax=Psychromicrobium lacuslunae TaxID=1618207 RepID=A0A0D4C1F9_9MICC|nr:site-specific DNA-methyltransferase [Psychromicrobium lacuslunae]AJT42399.1 hypothetical protein UM93_14480 [Psychromicrobium lacuslunae]